MDRRVVKVPAFCCDASPEVVWECVGFDAPWNGWASPVVDWATVIDVLNEAGWLYELHGAIFEVRPSLDADADEITVLEPDDDANYHLRDLGWTFMAAAAYETKILPFHRLP